MPEVTPAPIRGWCARMESGGSGGGNFNRNRPCRSVRVASCQCRTTASSTGRPPGVTTIPVRAPIEQTFDCTYATDGSIAGTDGTPGSGPDFWDFGLVECTQTDTVVITTDLDAFTGPDTFDIDIFVTGDLALTGVGDSTLMASDFVATCDVNVTLGFKTAAGACCLRVADRREFF